MKHKPKSVPKMTKAAANGTPISDRKILRGLSKMLGVREDELPRALEKRRQEIEETERKIRELRRAT